ncbi:MAG: alpha/beta hydrolase [bacterium]|uniref:Alpha/beta hydrolase n=1 Tax=Candidatus Methylomirabilis tolerans TaxID=3123416 RepID=A0AAJ1AJ50_9BACT|nr:alpha/beta hydrolase [Candidatus Methylomirabilis sp.]
MLIRVGDLDTHFTVCGEGRPMVLLHGWGTSAESMGAVAKSLEDRFRVYALDLPGFGWTPAAAAPWGTWEYAAYVEAFMDRVGIPVAGLIGHSFGGRIALALASRWPDRVRSLILVASAGIRPTRGPLYHMKVGATKLAKRLFSFPIWGRLGERKVAEIYRRVGSRDYRNAGPLRATLVKVVGEDLRSILSSIRVPTLIIWGDKDQEVPFSSMQIMARGIAGSRLEVLEGAGHFPFADRPDRFGRLVREFLCQDSR